MKPFTNRYFGRRGIYFSFLFMPHLKPTTLLGFQIVYSFSKPCLFSHLTAKTGVMKSMVKGFVSSPV